jgi:deoxyribodipyrimidine photo-lyase
MAHKQDVNPKSTVFWFRRDLRLTDNHGLFQALQKSAHVMLLFIFDTEILNDLQDRSDARVSFIYQSLLAIDTELRTTGRSICIKTGKPAEVWQQLLAEADIEAVYMNHDYEPYAIKRDNGIKQILAASNIPLFTYKDQVIFEKNEILKSDGTPYTVFTPYSRRWKQNLNELIHFPSENLLANIVQTTDNKFPRLEETGFSLSPASFPPSIIPEAIIADYGNQRDYPALDATSHLGLHLRFGTISIRMLMKRALLLSEVFANELIWREFYMMILWHFPQVESHSFKPAYDYIQWLNDEPAFEKWCLGKTGYPLVDAGMRQLNATGFMHNRLRMVTASFLTKHLLIDWRWGEAYFAAKLLDFELASNNGGWQWAAGTGVDAAPYFRVFSPDAQTARFDAKHEFIRKWIPEIDTPEYPQPIVNHEYARKRVLEVYKSALKK